MPFEPGVSQLIVVLLAAALGGGMGWPLAAWARRNMVRAVAVLPGAASAAPRISELAAPPVRGLPSACGALTAVGWGLAAWRLGLQPVLPALLAFVAAGSVLVIVDAAEHRLPNRVLGPASAAVAALLTLATAASNEWPALLWAVAGSVGMFAVYLLVALASPSAMGMGDVKLAGLIGLLLGWFGLETWLTGLVAAFVLGGLVALAALAVRRITLRGSIPFGPAMLGGAMVAMLVAG
ncbi:A24 family peptidase [Agromyces aerolatus]|uniref:A24 family peptidase n=1 Tax=Agromyces sp. LY-1074 TaxID=3074080 RepID=UPI0028644EEE|nr:MULTISPECIES: A24 family peptidase [unclassified Agromyces]MDR5701407.1 A24 family peptidase [Agromyces sp. LY-1074]MDR5706804.1 A24 family peptidase [Agromyces sp. LY-1358]